MDGTLPAGARHDLTDEQWAILASLLEALLPVGRKPGRPRRWTIRQLIDGIRFRTRTGCPWRDVPERYGTWQSVYGLFRAWQLAGTWAAILTGLQAMSAEAGLIEWVVSWTPRSTGPISTPPVLAAIPKPSAPRRPGSRPITPSAAPGAVCRRRCTWRPSRAARRWPRR